MYPKNKQINDKRLQISNLKIEVARPFYRQFKKSDLGLPQVVEIKI